ncbi:MAG: polysaccharide deacetylase [Brevundimonas sp.]|nr:MAG: polysaccharide deacetylase [Brevundimonas sp.]
MGGDAIVCAAAPLETPVKLATLTAAISCALSLCAGPAMANDWPGGARAAVVLTYDDAMPSQLETAIPALDAHGLKATFFLSNLRQADLPRWRAVAGEGHELANHTLFHACTAATFEADPRYVTEAYTIGSLLREIEQANVLLTAIDGRDRHGFATPCGQSTAGGLDYLEALRTSGLVTYVRGVSVEDADLGAEVAAVDRMRIPAKAFDADVTGAELIDWVRKAVDGGGLTVLLFHGVGGEHLPVSAEAHAELLDWLAAHRDLVWTTTLQDALDHAAPETAAPSR